MRNLQLTQYTNPINLLVLAIVCLVVIQTQLFAQKTKLTKNIKLNALVDQKALLIQTSFKNVDSNNIENFENVFIYDKFRIFYTHKGKHALINKFNLDKNKNNVPDFIEDIMTEIVVTKTLLDYYQFDLNKNIYKDIEYLDIFVSNSKEKKEHSAYYYGHKPNKKFKILSLFNLEQGNSLLLRVHQKARRLKKTVSHELFHAYQYGNTRLLNNWFVEGTAMWFEYALSKGVGPDTIRLPDSKGSFYKNVLSKSYGANLFWNRLTKLCSNSNKFTIPKSINPRSHYLIHKNQRIISDNLLYGFEFMQTLFNNLDKEDNLATKEYQQYIKNLNQINWSYNVQKSASNNYYLIKALKSTILSQCKNYQNNQELLSFLSLLDDNYLDSIYLAKDTINYWKVEDNQPANATVKMSFDKELQDNVIEFKGSGIKNGYRFKKNKLNELRNKTFKVRIKSTNKYAVFIKVLTKDKMRSLVYSNFYKETSNGKNQYYKYFKIPNTNSWQTIKRDLNRDLQKYEPNNEVISIIDIFTRGDFKLHNISFTNSKNKTNLNQNINFHYTPDKKCEDDITYAKNIWDMHKHDNKIYLATGNSKNTPPSCNAGPVPLAVFNLETKQIEFENKLFSYEIKNRLLKKIKKVEPFIKEEKIEKFLLIDNQLMIPGHDPTQNWSYGNIYKKNSDGWTQYRTLKNVVHTYDIASFDHKLFACGSIYHKKSFKPYIAISNNKGKSWKYQILNDKNRVFNFIKIGNRLLATTIFNSKKNNVAYEYDAGKFYKNSKLSNNFFFKQNKPRNIKIIKDIAVDQNNTFFIAIDYQVEHLFKTLGLFQLTTKNNKLQNIKIDTLGYRVVDFIKHNNTIYLLGDKYKNGIYEIQVFALNENRFSLKPILNFNSHNIIRSFEADKNMFYFGVGIEIDKHNNYYPNSKKEQTGTIITKKIPI